MASTRTKRNRTDFSVKENSTPKTPRISEPSSHTKLPEYLDRCLSKQTAEVMVGIEKRLVQPTEEVTKQIIPSELKILQQFSELSAKLEDVEGRVDILFNKISTLENQISGVAFLEQRVNQLEDKLKIQVQLQNTITTLGEKADRLENMSVANEVRISDIDVKWMLIKYQF